MTTEELKEMMQDGWNVYVESKEFEPFWTTLNAKGNKVVLDKFGGDFYYLKKVIIRVKDEGNEQLIAYLNMDLIICKDAEIVFETADSLVGDIYGGIAWLLKSGKLKYGKDVCVGYIRVLYVLPEYRHLGISSLLFNNLPHFIKKHCNLRLQAISTAPALMETKVQEDRVFNVSVKEKPYSKEDEELLKIMIKNLIKNKFEKTKGEEYQRFY